MENFYTAYTKSINGVRFYFVKKYQTFPEYKNVPSILDSYGMHTNFKKACKIALIQDKAIQEKLLSDIEQSAVSAKVIKLNRSKSDLNQFKTWQNTLPALFKKISGL